MPVAASTGQQKAGNELDQVTIVALRFLDDTGQVTQYQGQIMLRNYLPVIGLALLASGCASGPPFIDTMQPKAIDIAQRRAQFDMNCPDAKGEVLTRQEIQPLVFGGPLRATYTIGVIGCGQRASIEVLCSNNNDGCVEARR
jgi:hypothetical protein